MQHVAPAEKEIFPFTGYHPLTSEAIDFCRVVARSLRRDSCEAKFLNSVPDFMSRSKTRRKSARDSEAVPFPNFPSLSDMGSSASAFGLIALFSVHLIVCYRLFPLPTQ
ncbi:MAG: hypothetical protein DIU74_004810 [Pseudomonadota bacterium]